MGCCLSTKHPPSQTPDRCSGAQQQNPPPIEEETVKEVLSETPVLKLAHSPTPKLPEEKSNRYQVPETQDLNLEVLRRSQEPTLLIKASEDREVSEPSEQYSYSESLSTTTTGMEKKDDGEEVTQRSPVRVRRRRPNVVGDRGVRSPARRRHMPPVASSRATGPQWRNGGPPSSVRREPAGGSSRRSRSPAATRGQNVRHRSENGRPGRASDDSADVSRPESCKIEKANRDDEDEDETGETIENPLVSLECFIFL